jgi:hypothetical protein
MRPPAESFVAFTGFTQRAEVARVADYRVASFSELTALVFRSSRSTR